MRRIRGLLLTGMLLPWVANAMQESSKLTVDPAVMVGRCVTMVSPQSAGIAVDSAVVVRVVVSATGRVSPVRVISGPPALAPEAMDAVRLWRYRPYIREDTAIDVVTDVKVKFEAGKPGGLISHPNR